VSAAATRAAAPTKLLQSTPPTATLTAPAAAATTSRYKRTRMASRYCRCAAMAVESADRNSVGRSSSSRVSEAAWSVVFPLALVRTAVLLPDYETPRRPPST